MIRTLTLIPNWPSESTRQSSVIWDDERGEFTGPAGWLVTQMVIVAQATGMAVNHLFYISVLDPSRNSQDLAAVLEAANYRIPPELADVPPLHKVARKSASSELPVVY